MITPTRLALVCVFAGFVHAAKPAEACSCASLSAKGYMASADRVFVGRALPAVKRGATFAQRFEVVLTLKGPHTTWKHIHFIQGTLDVEGVTFAVLLDRRRMKVLNQYRVER